jgi:hypothetical protein
VTEKLAIVAMAGTKRGSVEPPDFDGRCCLTAAKHIKQQWLVAPRATGYFAAMTVGECKRA